MLGERFGKLTVIGYGKKVGKKQYYICQCDCGNKKEIRVDRLKSGITKNCGCVEKSKNNIIGKRFGRLTVVKEGETYRKRDGRSVGKYYVCRCDCGKELNVLRSSLVIGFTTSCGCKNEEMLKNVKAEQFGVEYGTNVRMIEKNDRLSQANTSGIRGVSWHKGKQKWSARITFRKKTYWLGAYDTKEEAAEIRKIAEEKIFGKFLEWYNEQKGKEIK